MKADQNELYYLVAFLSTMQPPRNYLHLESMDRAASFIEANFRRYGLEPAQQNYQIGDHKYCNIIASYNPEAKQRLIVGAHYDVFGEFPGADDNASAVAGLLETARLISHEQPELEYRIDFVAYSLEEPPFYGSGAMGSAVHARSLAEQKVPVLGMICYEMIGYFSDEPGSQRVPYSEMEADFPDQGNFIVLVGLQTEKEFVYRILDNMRSSSSTVPVLTTLFSTDDIVLAGMSDHVSYWEHGFKALMINDTSFFRNPNYHTAGDTIDTLDFTRMGEVVTAACRAVTGF